MSGNESVPKSTSCIMCIETNRMTDNIVEAGACDVISCCGREKHGKLGHIVRESSCLSQPPLCLLSTTSKNISSVPFFSSPHGLTLLLSPHQGCLSAAVHNISLYLISHQFEQLQLPSNNVECCNEKQLTLPQ